MSSFAPIRVLLVHDDPAVASTVALVLKKWERGCRYRRAASADAFSAGLDGQLPDLILTGEDGVPGLTLKEIVETALDRGIPSVVLGERRGGAFPAPGEGADCFLRLTQLAWLPMAAARALRQHQARTLDARLEEQAQRTADLMRGSQKLATIGRLTGSIAHEINNPLESVTNLLFLIESEPGLSQTARNYLTLAQRELDRVAQISKQTLNFYRETPSPVRVELGDLLEEVLVLYARRIAEKRLEVIRRFGAGEPMLVFPGEIRQIFSNLVSNAIEASPLRGKLHLRIRRSRFWGDSGINGLRVTIADSGMGIPPEALRHLGEPFFTTKGEGGTGLGLWVTRSILARYRGTLVFRSSTGAHAGTVISLFVPTNLQPHAVASAFDQIASELPRGPTLGGSRSAPGRARRRANDEGRLVTFEPTGHASEEVKGGTPEGSPPPAPVAV